MVYSINKSNHLIGTLLLNREAVQVETRGFNRLKLDIVNDIVKFNFEFITDTFDRYQSHYGKMYLNELPNYWAMELQNTKDVSFNVTSIINNNKFLGHVIEN